MNVQFDHLVFFVENLHDSVEQFRQKGFHVAYGGSHPMWGTFNALIYFDNCYIELIAIENEEVFAEAAEKKFTLHETFENNKRIKGTTRIALRTNDASRVADSLAAGSFEVDGPATFSRNKPDGKTLSWQLVHFGTEASRTLPFIIDWQQDVNQMYQHLREENILAAHENGVQNIQQIIFNVQNHSFKDYVQLLELLNVPFVQTEASITAKFKNVEIVFSGTLNFEVNFSSSKNVSNFNVENTQFKFVS